MTRCGPGATSRRRGSRISRSSGVDGSLAFPTFPRFCGQTFMEGKDHELGLECVRAYNDWMIDEWCARLRRAPDPAVPHSAVGRRPRGRRGHAQRRTRRAGDLLQRDPDASRAPEHPHRLLGSAVRGVPGDAHVLCMHIGSSSKMPAASPDAPPSTDIMLSFNNSMASLADFLFSGVLVRFPELKLAYSEGQIGWIPYALERADNVVGVPLELDTREGDDPRATVDVLPRAHLRLLHQRRARDGVSSPRSARTTSASRPTTRTRTRRGRSRVKRSNA